jgi:chemotaxis protein methyltransferase CheR
MFSLFKKKKEKVTQDNQMEIDEDFTDISLVALFFQNETGITFDKQMGILKNKVTLFCKQRNIYSFYKLIDILHSDIKVKQELIDYLTTNETYFYREFKQIEILVELVKQENRNIQILCAPSATGEEPYSIAIALLEAGIVGNTFHITGIDINQKALSRAKSAIYGQRNVRNLSEDILKRYFVKERDKYSLKQSIKSLVTFQQVNIFDEKFLQLGKFDFVFSRNMLIYFDKETKQKAKKILESMRKDDEYDVFFGHADLF